MPEKPVKMILDGHGTKPFTRQDLKRLHDYFKETRESVEKAHKQGISLEQIKIKCAINDMPSAKALFNTPFADNVENLRKTHEHNIEFIANKLN